MASQAALCALTAEPSQSLPNRGLRRLDRLAVPRMALGSCAPGEREKEGLGVATLRSDPRHSNADDARLFLSAG